MSYLPADWYAGVKPPKGWDCADMIEDGWSLADIDKWIREVVSDTLSPFVPHPEPAPVATPLPDPAPVAAPVRARPLATAPDRPVGVSGADRMPVVTQVEIGSEVDIAQVLSASLIEACGGRVVHCDGAFWAWGPTDWQKIPDQRLRSAVHRFDGAQIAGGKTAVLKIGKRTIDGVLSEAGTVLGEAGFFDHPAVGLNALNVVVTIDASGKVGTQPHDPDDRFRFTIPASFELHTDMVPPPGSMLHTLLDGAFRDEPDAAEKMMLIGEILGSAAFGLATRLPRPKAFVFLGETASNGKSTIASLLSCLLPKGSVSSIAPAAFSDPARIVNLAGKAANVADELSAAAVSGEAFKAAITGDPIEGRDLYRSAITFIPRAIHVFTTNTLPRFNGGLDRGLQRRLVVLAFTRPIPEKEIIPDIADRIERDELDLLLGFAIAGAIRLIKNRGYTTPASSVEALRNWLMVDPVNEWFDAHVTRADSMPLEGWPKTRDLFNDFKNWAIREGHAERFLPPVNTFTQRLKSLPNVIIKRTSTATIASGVSCAFKHGSPSLT